MLGRGTIDWPGHELHGAKVDVLQHAPGDDLIVRMREPHGPHRAGTLAWVKRERVKLSPP